MTKVTTQRERGAIRPRRAAPDMTAAVSVLEEQIHFIHRYVAECNLEPFCTFLTISNEEIEKSALQHLKQVDSKLDR